jgi:integrase
MALIQRGGVWYADFRATGGPRVSLKTREERVAKEKHAALELAHLRGQDVRHPEGGLSLAVACDRAFHAHWRDYARRAELKVVLDELKAFFGDRTPLSRITEGRLWDYVEELQGAGLKGATINRRLAVVSKLFTLAKAWGALTETPRIPRQKESPPAIRWYHQDEEHKVLDYCGEAGYPTLGRLVMFLADTGWRLNEALGLTWDRVTPLGLELRPEDQKSGKHTYTPSTPRVKRVLESQRIVDAEGPFRALQDWQAEKQWDRVRGVMGWGLESNLHAWRHTTATRLVAARVDVKTVMEFMRHSDIRTTMRYVHLVGGALDGAVSALSQFTAQSHAVTGGATVVPLKRVS